MAGGDVHEAGPLVGFDKAGSQQRDVEVIALTAQRVRCRRSGKRRAGKSVNERICLDSGRLYDFLHQLGGDEQGLSRPCAAPFRRPVDPQHHILEAVAEGDRAVARQCPRRCRPNQRRGAGERRPHGMQDRETHPHGRGSVVVVFDFRFSQRGLLHDRPKDRLCTLVEPPIEQKLAELADDLRLGRIRHRRVGIFPIADDAEPLEVALLNLDPMGREFAALAAELVDRHAVLGLVFRAVLLLDDPFDRQAVAVPARHIGRVLAEHLLRPVDHVLQDLV